MNIKNNQMLRGIFFLLSIIGFLAFSMIFNGYAQDIDDSYFLMSNTPQYQQADPNKVWWVKDDPNQGVYRVQGDEGEGYTLYYQESGQDVIKAYYDENSKMGEAYIVHLLIANEMIYFPRHQNPTEEMLYFTVEDLSTHATQSYRLDTKVNLGSGIISSGHSFLTFKEHMIYIIGGVNVVVNNSEVTVVYQNPKNGVRPKEELPISIQEQIDRVLEGLKTNGFLSPSLSIVNTNMFTCSHPFQCKPGEIFVEGLPDPEDSLSGATETATGGFECKELPLCCCDPHEIVMVNGEEKCFNAKVLLAGILGDSNQGVIGDVKREAKNHVCGGNTFGLDRDPGLCWDKKGKGIANSIREISKACGGEAVKTPVEGHGLCAGGLALAVAGDYLATVDFPVHLHFWNTPFDGAKAGPIIGGLFLDTICIGFNNIWMSPEMNSIRYGDYPDDFHPLDPKRKVRGFCHVGTEDGVVSVDSQSKGPENCKIIKYPGDHGGGADAFDHDDCCGDGQLDPVKEECESPGDWKELSPRCYEWCLEGCKKRISCAADPPIPKTMICPDGILDPNEECEKDDHCDPGEICNRECKCVNLTPDI